MWAISSFAAAHAPAVMRAAHTWSLEDTAWDSRAMVRVSVCTRPRARLRAPQQERPTHAPLQRACVALCAP